MIGEIEQLTKSEKAWVKRLEKVLMSCPERLGLYTIGDKHLAVYDARFVRANDIDYDDSNREWWGKADVAYVNSAVFIDGLAG